MEIDAQSLIHERNAFYRYQYYWALGLFLLSIAANIGLFFVLLYLIRNPTFPYYFAADAVARLEPADPITQPGMATQDVVNWAIHAIETANNYDFVNYRGELQDAQKYFTDYGWRKFMQGLTLSNNLLAVMQRKYVLSAKVVSPPKILTQGILGGAYSWKMQMPVLITVLTPPNYDDQSKILNPWLITVIVQRREQLQSYGGLGIAQYIGEVAH